MMGGTIPGQAAGMVGMNGMIPVISDGVNTFQLTPLGMQAMQGMQPLAMQQMAMQGMQGMQPIAMQAFGPLRGTRVSHRTGSGHGCVGYDNQSQFPQGGIPIQVFDVDC